MSPPPLLVPGRSAEKCSNGKTCPGTSSGGRPRRVWGGCECAGYETYGFQKPKDREAYFFPEVIEGLLHDPPDYVGREFSLGGRLVKEMDAATQEKLQKLGVTLDRDPRRLLETVAKKALV